jgi:hypothetical protein
VANVTIPGIATSATSLAAADLIEVSQGGTSKQASIGLIPGRLLAIQRFASAQTVTPTYNANTNSIIIKLLGAGGGGRSVAAPSAGVVAIGQPGDGGAYLEKRLTTGFSGKQLVVGTAGTGGSATTPPNSGTNGTATTFDAAGANYSAGGGAGGTATNSAPYGWIVYSGGAAVASNGDLNVASKYSLNFSTSASGSPSASSLGGSPGNPVYGQGAVTAAIVSTSAVAGATGAGNGAGGSGAICFNGNTPLAGGNGTDGYAEIWEFS